MTKINSCNKSSDLGHNNRPKTALRLFVMPTIFFLTLSFCTWVLAMLKMLEPPAISFPKFAQCLRPFATFEDAILEALLESKRSRILSGLVLLTVSSSPAGNSDSQMQRSPEICKGEKWPKRFQKCRMTE